MLASHRHTGSHMEVKIEYLADCPDAVPVLAQWLFDEWGYRSPDAPLFIIGFPLGLRSEAYATPIVRRAIVARSDAVVIIVDGFVYPGNSGGPVIYEPSVQLGPSFSTPILQGDWLAGMVLSEISYVEPAISVHTGRPRITFEDNSGLCNVLPAELILELLSSQEFSKLDASVK